MKRFFMVHYCKSRMVAFVNGDLSEQARRRVARYIDECPACYDEYIRQRELKRDLDTELRQFGQPSDGQLDRMWAAIQGELNSPPAYHNRGGRSPVLRARYGLATLALMIAMLLPLLMDSNSVTQAAVTQPTPVEVLSVSIVTTTVPEAYTERLLATQPTPANQTIQPTPEAAPERTPEVTRTH